MAEYVHNRDPATAEVLFDALAQLPLPENSGIDYEIGVVAGGPQRCVQPGGVFSRVIEVLERGQIRLIPVAGTDRNEAANPNAQRPPRPLR